MIVSVEGLLIWENTMAGKFTGKIFCGVSYADVMSCCEPSMPCAWISEFMTANRVRKMWQKCPPLFSTPRWFLFRLRWGLPHCSAIDNELKIYIEGWPTLLTVNFFGKNLLENKNEKLTKICGPNFLLRTGYRWQQLVPHTILSWVLIWPRKL